MIDNNRNTAKFKKHPLKQFLIIYLFIGYFLVFSGDQHILAQNLDSQEQAELRKYEKLIARHHKENNMRKELDYCSKVAFIYWQNNMFQQAGDYFERCLEINEKLGNQNGTKLTNYYLGMIYSKQEAYSKALEAFQNGLKISRELNLKNSILSGLLNLSQTYQVMEDFDQSNKYTLEALELAKQQDDLKSVRTCYGLLSENYKSLGNPEKSMEYFDLFSTIDRHLKSQKISDIQNETQSRVSQAEAENQKTKKELEEEIDKRKMTEDSLQKVERISRERQLQLEMKELEIQNKQKQLKLERTIRN